MCTIHKIKSEADQYRSPGKREEGTVLVGGVYKVWLFLETKLGQSDAVARGFTCVHCCQQSVFLSRRTRKSTEGPPPPLCLRDQKIWRKRMKVGDEVLLYCILPFFVLGKSLHRSQLWTAERERADVILRFISPWFLSSQAASPPLPPISLYSHRERRIPNQRGEQSKS